MRERENPEYGKRTDKEIRKDKTDRKNGVIRSLAILIAAAVIVILGGSKETKAAVYPVSSSSKNGIVFIGDSRTVGMRSAVGTSAGMSTWSCMNGAGYSWFVSTGVPGAEPYIISGTRVVILMGVNDLRYGPEHMADEYASFINGKASLWKSRGVSVFFVSVNPVNDAQIAKSAYTDAAAVRFNAEIREKLSGDVFYVDTYSAISGKCQWSDGLHFRNVTYRMIYRLITASVQKSSGTYVPPSVKSIAVSGLGDKMYTGKPVTQSLTLTFRGLVLAEGTDYTLSYSNNKKVGLAGVKIVLNGNFSGTISRSFHIIPAASSETVPIYVFYNASTKDHFYTADALEKKQLEASYRRTRRGYCYQGIMGYVSSRASADCTPLYRFWNPVSHDHFYTTNKGERDSLIRSALNRTTKYKYEGIACYTPKQTAKCVWRFYGSREKDHYYTSSAASRAELNRRAKSRAADYREEGIGWYLK